MTRDEGLLISLQKEPHNWTASIDSTYLAPNGDKYTQYVHHPTKTVINMLEPNDSDDSEIRLSFGQIVKNGPMTVSPNPQATFGANDLYLHKDSEIIEAFRWVYKLSEMNESENIHFQFLSHIERIHEGNTKD